MRGQGQARQNHCKHPAHSCVVGCKERGGGLTYGDSRNSSGNDNNALVCWAGPQSPNLPYSKGVGSPVVALPIWWAS